MTLEQILSRAWTLLRRSPILVLPFLIFLFVTIFLFAASLALLVVAVMHTDRHQLSPAGAAAAVAVFAVWACAVIGQAWVAAATYNLADAVWTRGSATLADARTKLLQRGARMFVAGIGFAGLFLVALLLAIPTLGLAFIALFLFTMYTFSAVVAGDRDGFSAIAESFRLVRGFFGLSALAEVILIAISYAFGFVVLPFLVPLQIAIATSPVDAHGRVPFSSVPMWTIASVVIGYVLMFALTCAYQAFVALVQTGLYHELRARMETSVPAVPTSI